MCILQPSVLETNQVIVMIAKSGVIELSISVCSEPAFPNKIILPKPFIINYISMISSFRKDMLN